MWGWGKGEDRKGASGTPDADEGRSSPWDGEDASVLLLRLMKRRLTGEGVPPAFVIPAEAGIQGLSVEVDSRFRGNDGLSGVQPPVRAGGW